eukprot:GHVP01010469.1.p1 GENE.GHVP01010469.1~~GHVP01010469.1.p1  ORF type:complete len:405 (+),score=50.07 GHVP01010469.1:954-2168(+)
MAFAVGTDLFLRKDSRPAKVCRSPARSSKRRKVANKTCKLSQKPANSRVLGMSFVSPQNKLAKNRPERENRVFRMMASPSLKKSEAEDFITTPGRNRIDLGAFLMDVDNAKRNECYEHNPALAALASYAHDNYAHWKSSEMLVESGAYMLSFPEKSESEGIRMMAVQCIFNYCHNSRLNLNTVHLAITNINRLLHHNISKNGAKFSDALFSCTVLSALRSSIKFEETPHQVDKFRLNPTDVWEASGFCRNLCIESSAEALNSMETNCLEILSHPYSPPIALEFLERFLSVGQWPQKSVVKYRELASFLLGLSLFVHGEGNPLMGTPPSKMAAASLVLAIKVVNTDDQDNAWEFWPEKLECYSGYHIRDLRMAIRGLSLLLRKKPPHSRRVIEKVFPKWGPFDWS